MFVDSDFDVRLHRFHPARDTGPRLLCTPHAGGSAGFFRQLSAALTPGVEVLAAQYPGRSGRYREQPLDNIEAMAADITRVMDPLLDRPLALFGHSMGAVVAFEIAHFLERKGAVPLALFVSGYRGPSAPQAGLTHQLSDAMLVRELRAVQGTNPGYLDHPEGLRLLLPTVRRDLRAAEMYQSAHDQPLRCPVVAMIGTADPKVTTDEAGLWSDETTADFQLRTYTGGHFYLNDHFLAIGRSIAADLDGSHRGSGRAGF